MPARAAAAPRRLPPGVLGRRLVRLPEREVARILLERARLLALLDLVRLLAGQPAIVGEARDSEVDVAAGDVGVAARDQLLDEAHDRRHRLRRLREEVGHPEAEVAGVLEVPLGRARCELRALARRRLVDLVVDVRDVVHQRRVGPGRLQPRAEPHPDHERPRVPDVCACVHRRAADVHAHRRGSGRHLDERARIGVVEAQGHLFRLVRGAMPRHEAARAIPPTAPGRARGR